MFQPFQSSTPLQKKLPVTAAHRVVEVMMRLLSVYLVPAGVALASVLALALWNSHDVASGGQALGLRVVAEGSGPLQPAAALRQLAQAEPVDFYDTHLSEAPLWFRLRTSGVAGDLVEFPSRHALAIRCWDAATLQLLGDASRGGESGALAAVKSGFALRLPNVPADVLCRATFSGPAHLTALLWPAGELALSTQQFHRQSGLLDGGMIVLSLFILITAIINRQVLYLQFAAWLILNLRVGALSAGWDTQWLGQLVPPDWLLPSRALTMALYSISTVTLYMTLFGAELLRTRFATPLRIMQWVCLVLLPCALWLPYGNFLPVMWGIVAAGLTLMILGLVNLMLRSQSRVAIWFAASFVVTYLGGLTEVFSAALGARQLLGVANSVANR